MGNTVDENKSVQKTREMHGRRVIKSSVREITRDNVVDVLTKALVTHDLNRSEIEYLWNYYRGKQPILNRVKDVRPEICNKIVENRANEIVSFKVGYLCGEPIQYVSRNGNEQITKAITALNELMFAEDKATQDQEIVEWQMICGTAFRLVLPDTPGDEDEAPFEMYTLDPRDTFIVYSNDIGNKPLMAVKYARDEETQVTTYSVYTENRYFLIEDTIVKENKPHALDMIPIFEYPANNARLGSFEIVLPLLDMINNIESNRMDGMEQTIQAFIKFVNCDITAEDFTQLKELGAIKVKSVDGANADVDIVTNDLNQDQSQTLKEDCYNAILTICGMPNRNGGSSTSDTGAAVLLRDGWSLAEARAKDSEHIFKKSEKKMLKLVLRICRDLADGIDLHLRDIDMKFTRRNYEAIQSKSQVLISMLEQPKIHPLLAFEHSGLFTDPESAYALSMKYYEEQMEKWQPVEVSEDEDEEDEDDVSADGQVSQKSESSDQK
nr:MAG TPA: Portal [Caudoviricetes sp.]